MVSINENQVSTISDAVKQTKKMEHMADVITHGVGVILSLAAFMYLIVSASMTEDFVKIISISVYGISLITAYFSSTIYHLYLYYHHEPHKKFKRLLLIFDHSCIFFLIAGTYTPILITFFNNTTGWILFSIIWLLAIAGIGYKIAFIGKYRHFSLGLYFTMGWNIVVSFWDMLRLFPLGLIYWLVAGGIFYTAGIIFFQYRKMPFNHAIWHIFVLIGSVLHFFGVVKYVL